MERLLPADGWWSRTDAIKITGSNGKGSVALTASEILGHLGLRVGLYTSPHLRSFAERIRVGGEPASTDVLAEAMAWLRPRLEPPVSSVEDPPSAFDAMTALALRVFEMLEVELVVSEAGIGGRHDATRILRGSVTVLTSVDLEHTEILGETAEEIATDKAALADDGSWLLVGALSEEVRRAVEAACAPRGVSVESAPPLPEEWPELAALPPYQRRNAALAAAAVERRLAVGGGPRIDPARMSKAVRAALSTVHWPGRMEKIAEDPEIWIDVAHTPGALRAVVEAVAELEPKRPLLVVFGASADKEARVGSMVSALEPVAARFICTRAHHRGGSVDVVERAVRRSGRPWERSEELASALGAARERASEGGMRVLVTGGLFLAVEAAELVAGRHPKDLYFY